MRLLANVLAACLCLAGCGAKPVTPGAIASPDQQFSPPQPDATLTGASTEFQGADALAGWTDLQKSEGGADWIQSIDVDHTVPGALYLVPKVCGWFDDYRGVLLYRQLTGDVVMHMRLRVQGAAAEDPARTYSLGGAMLRTPNQANWNFITVGTGDHPRQVETKTTVNGASELHLQSGASGWNEIVLARMGSFVVTAYRPDGGAWRVMSRWHRTDLPATLQWGIATYTDWPDASARPAAQANATPSTGSPDVRLSVDFVRFSRPAAPANTSLDDTSHVTDSLLLRLIVPAQ